MALKIIGAGGSVKLSGTGGGVRILTPSAPVIPVVTYEWTPKGGPTHTFTSADFKVKLIPDLGFTIPVYVDPAFVQESMGGGALRIVGWTSNNPYGADALSIAMYDAEIDKLVQLAEGLAGDDFTFTVDDPSAADLIFMDPRLGGGGLGTALIIFPPDVAALFGVTWP